MKILSAVIAPALLVPALALACPCDHEAKTTTAAAVAAPAGAGGDASAPAKQTKVTIPVDGMTCGGCASNVKTALTAVEGVKSVEVSLKTNQAVVTCDEKVKPEQLTKAIDAAGYKAGTPVKN